ncbi:transforming growth factor-beta-induced protein ig-h3-like [Gigantopelta aegis]|uniref:transforming growth factor-beta-induced protein ig-h3-like n=1 Tax=Gigantopelta aegis TaxID=1735272 RepID=UPI001B887939|nr:transforming growth factor-beta-induced protein ig-h3-like [Gigantopelta aegis]
MFIFVLCVSLWASASGADHRNALAYLSQHSEYSTFVSLFKLADLEWQLENAHITVLAPTNAAFAAIPAHELAELKNNTAELKKMLLYHIINRTVVTANIGHQLSVKTLSGSELTFRDYGHTVLAGSATMIGSDIIVSNGVVHTVSDLLMPPPNLTISQYIIKNDAELKDFFAAVIVAHLEATLEGGKFTVFAPTDEAFRKYGKRFPPDLLGVRQFVRNHLVHGIYLTPDLTNRTLPSLAGHTIHVYSDSGGVTVEGAKIIRPNIFLLNGVVHVVDKVID